LISSGPRQKVQHFQWFAGISLEVIRRRWYETAKSPPAVGARGLFGTVGCGGRQWPKATFAKGGDLMQICLSSPSLSGNSGQGQVFFEASTRNRRPRHPLEQPGRDERTDIKGKRQEVVAHTKNIDRPHRFYKHDGMSS
jgi:hypothetical protein